MIKFMEKFRTLHILLLAAVLTALGFTATGLKGYMAENSARKNGSLSTISLQVQDLEMEALKPADGGWRSTDTDPQLHYVVNGSVTSVYMEMDSLLYPGNVIMYYLNPGDTDFSAQKRIFLVQDPDNPGCYYGNMPLQQITRLRIDPTSVGGNILSFGNIVINPQGSQADYLHISAYTVLMYMIYTVLLAAILRFIQEFFTKSFQ